MCGDMAMKNIFIKINNILKYPAAKINFSVAVLTITRRVR